jgi:hypothetical protein
MEMLKARLTDVAEKVRLSVVVPDTTLPSHISVGRAGMTGHSLDFGLHRDAAIFLERQIWYYRTGKELTHPWRLMPVSSSRGNW